MVNLMMLSLLATAIEVEPAPIKASDQASLLVKSTKVATLSTMREKRPFGSLVHYTLDSEGRPLLFLSDLAVHSDNLKKNSNASIFVSEQSEKPDLDIARVTLMGELKIVPEDEMKKAKEFYFKKNPIAKIYARFHDFQLYRLEIEEIYYVGGFGPKPIEWVNVDEYKEGIE